MPRSEEDGEMSEELTPLHRDISAAEAPIYQRLMDALKKCRSARQISQCIEAYGRLIDTERDAVMQRHGYPPRHIASKETER